MDGLITEVLSAPRWLPAATQGTIGVQCRSGDQAIARIIAVLNDAEAELHTRAERAVATALQGSCQVPLAVYATNHASELLVSAMVGTPDGQRVLRAQTRGAPEHADELAAIVAGDLISQGADQIIAELSG